MAYRLPKRDRNSEANDVLVAAFTLIDSLRGIETQAGGYFQVIICPQLIDSLRGIETELGGLYLFKK